MPAPEQVDVRLNRKTLKTESCWLWLGTTTKSGHGQIRYHGDLIYTHVMAYFLETLSWPDKGEIVRHTCDTPNCVNPEHLILGSHTDNMHDMISRHPGLPSMKLTQVQVDEIRSLSESYSQTYLAKKYGVNQSTISRILSYSRRSVTTSF